MPKLRIACLLIALASYPFGVSAQHNVASCVAGLNCLLSASSPSPDPSSLEAIGLLANSEGLVPVQIRMSHIGGPIAHKWVQFGTGENAVTFGYGAADFPLIDSGQIVVTDRKGVELVSRWHFLPGHITPAEAPDRGHTVGPPAYITVAQAQKIMLQQRRHRFVVPYIPLFHDCHTYVCALMASAQGKSALPCYLFFKGHF
jgi:hypothetical protein